MTRASARANHVGGAERGRRSTVQVGDVIDSWRVEAVGDCSRYTMACVRCGRTRALYPKQARRTGCGCKSDHERKMEARRARVGEPVGNFVIDEVTEDTTKYGAVYLMRCSACGDTVYRVISEAREQVDCGCGYGQMTEHQRQRRERLQRKGPRQYEIDWDVPWEQDPEVRRFVRDHPVGATLEQVAIEYAGSDGSGVTRERIRQIEARAIDKLKRTHPQWLERLYKEMLERTRDAEQSPIALCAEVSGAG